MRTDLHIKVDNYLSNIYLFTRIMRSQIILCFKLLTLHLASSSNSTGTTLARNNTTFTTEGIQTLINVSNTTPLRKSPRSPSSSQRADRFTSFPETTPATTKEHSSSGRMFGDLSSIASSSALGGSVVVFFVAVVLIVFFRHSKDNSPTYDRYDIAITQTDENVPSEVTMDHQGRHDDQDLSDDTNLSTENLYSKIAKAHTVEENDCTIENGISDKTNEPSERLGDTEDTLITEDNETAGRYQNKDGLVYVDIEFGNIGSTLIPCTSTNSDNAS
ncbi:uncharacterized protein LOC125676086 [Ostrea edulis]|uniref:uncharacterized protein LOC125676086 n=1 Tax=Ostrea edulis TaxID=37623 RepID=UPI0024AEE8FA|nr:uncharacterized protein LOC125676086 [Ostrea edulis]